MTDIASNRTGEYLKFHIEAETDIPQSNFEIYWANFLMHLRRRAGGEKMSTFDVEYEKNIARTWYEMGAMDARAR